MDTPPQKKKLPSNSPALLGLNIALFKLTWNERTVWQAHKCKNQFLFYVIRAILKSLRFTSKNSFRNKDIITFFQVFLKWIELDLFPHHRKEH